jgi:hypothetical protein
MNFFLKLRHWQLFLITWGVPIILNFFTIGNPFLIVKLAPYMMAFFAIGTFGWIWSIATALHSKLPPDVKINLNVFKILFAIPSVYLAGMVIWTSDLLSGGPVDSSKDNSAMIALIIIPLHLISMFCVFMCLRFAVKIMKSVELGRMAKVGDYIGDFMFIWMMPIGVWFVQPRLNRLVE